MQALDPMWKVERLADPTHLGKAQFRKSNSAKFSESMFPGRTRLMRAHSQKIFSQDLKARSSLIFKDLMKLHNGNMDIITKRLPAVLDAIVSCYSGDCSKCKQHSVVCSRGDSNNWWTRSLFDRSKSVRKSDNRKGQLDPTLHRPRGDNQPQDHLY